MNDVSAGGLRSSRRAERECIGKGQGLHGVGADPGDRSGATALVVLRRMADTRVQQYWDPRHALSEQMKKDARPPQPTQDCCERRGHLWDLAAVYPPGATWTDRLPTATLFNGPWWMSRISSPVRWVTAPRSPADTPFPLPSPVPLLPCCKPCRRRRSRPASCTLRVVQRGSQQHGSGQSMLL